MTMSVLRPLGSPSMCTNVRATSWVKNRWIP